LNINIDPERLDEGAPEERACFAALGIYFGSECLTEGHDGFVNKVRPEPLLSGYHLAEWIAWNWWRLRWEPRSNAPNWQFAHHLTTIGEGYVWPNITVFSDGERIALVAKPTPERPDTPFRYLSNAAAVVSAREFEYVVDKFIEQVRGLLRDEQIESSNLDSTWNDLQEERGDPDTSIRRKFEALLGCDPGHTDAATIERLVSDSRTLGAAAMNEIAAEYPHGGVLLTAESLHAIATRSGFDGSSRDVVSLAPGTVVPHAGELPAWRLGAEAAKAVREQTALGSGPINNAVLARMAGVEERALTERTPGPTISFALDGGDGKSRLVLRSKWPTGRRFELARILGDRIDTMASGRLFPATRAYTYRQKMQRSFAAELLSPFEVLDDMLSGDYSMESQKDAAEYFQVSELTIRTLLVNHHRLDREDLNEEFGIAAA
jgi:hypothetical protein